MVNDSEFIINNIVKLIKGAQLLELPIIWVEQYPKGLGPTVEEIKTVVSGTATTVQKTVNVYENDEFKEAIELTGCETFLLTGIESHVCVYQTGASLLANDYEIEIVEDAVSSRTKKNKE